MLTQNSKFTSEEWEELLELISADGGIILKMLTELTAEIKRLRDIVDSSSPFKEEFEYYRLQGAEEERNRILSIIIKLKCELNPAYTDDSHAIKYLREVFNLIEQD